MEVKPGYKQTEVGVIPEEWTILPVTGATISIFLGLTSKVDYVTTGGIPLVRATDISGGRLSFEAARTISLRQHRELTKYRRAKRGDVLVSKSGSLGVCAIVDVDYEFSIYESIIVLQPNHWIDSLFLLSLLRDEATQNRMIGDRVGSTVAHLNLEVFRTLVIPVPPLPEQRAIATALSDVDGLLGRLDRLIAKKRDLKQAAMQQLLTGQTRLPGFHGEWEETTLGDIGKFKNGLNKDSGAFGHGSPFVNLMDVFGVNAISSTSHLGLVASTKMDREVYDLRQGDVLFIRSSVKPSGVGLTAVVECGLTDTVYSGFLIRFRDEGALDSGFKKHCFYAESFRKKIIAASSVSANTNINQNALGGLTLLLPPTKAEQTAIAEALTEMDGELAALEQRREKTRSLKQAMMQELLTGRTRLV
jgi:type I restriction enzyme S subunit